MDAPSALSDAALPVAPMPKENFQPINMKVMRLLKPGLVQQSHADLEKLSETFETDGSEKNAFLLKEGLLLPQSFGTIYLGQNLSCYACISNVSEYDINDITVKVDFQVQSTGAPRSDMILNEGTPFRLESNRTYDFIINREIRDLGSHMMIANISYLNPLNPQERLNVKKCFRFTAARPMDFKNKFVGLPDGGYFGEFNIQNMTNTAMTLDSVRAITSPEFVAEQINPFENRPLKDLLDVRAYLNPNESRQFIFRFRVADRTKTGLLLKSNASPGRIEIIWRSRMGELGKVTTSALSRAVPDYRDIFFTMTKCPSEVNLHEVFTVTITAFSLCNRPMELQARFGPPQTENDSGFVWVGVSGRSIGVLEPGGMLDFHLSVVPCSKGLHLFPRFQLIEKYSGAKHDSEDLAEILVV